MTGPEAVARVRETFRDVPRPQGLFIRGTCRCCECEEHNATLAAHTPDTMSLEKFGNPGWDPMCFASDAAFAYFLPGMFHLAFEDPYYCDQLLFHLGLPDRLLNINRDQAQAMADALIAWAVENDDDPAKTCWSGYLETVLRRLEELARR